MSSLDTTIAEVLDRAESGSMNETNTRVLLIEPVLDALGWDTRDLESVTREYKVYDGSFLDYALMIGGKPTLFVEAKALGKNLTDSKWVAQAINYANNEGVTWCALTDGLRYQVYKTNEPVDMSQKLLFEVDIAETSADDEDLSVMRLSLLSRESIMRGDLDALGVRLFDDARVRDTLERLFTAPPSRFVRLVRDMLPEAERRLSPSKIQESLQRVGRSFLRADAPTIETARPVPAEPKAEKPRRGRTYTYERHFGDKPQVIVDLYRQLHERITGLGEDIERVYRAQYVGYRIGKKVMCSVIPQKRRLRLVLPLDPNRYSHHPLTRDISEVGHWGVGNTEATLESEDQMEQVITWIREAAELTRS